MDPTKYTLIQPIPGIQEVSSFPEYVSYFIPLLLGVAALMAVLQIVRAGFQRASAFGNESKIKESEEVISAAIMGLVLALAAYLILNIINPDLVNLKFFPEKVVIPAEKIAEKKAGEACAIGNAGALGCPNGLECDPTTRTCSQPLKKTGEDCDDSKNIRCGPGLACVTTVGGKQQCFDTTQR